MSVSEFVSRRYRIAVAPASSAITATGQIVPTGGLGWRPAEFWQATFAELDWALKGMAGDFGDKPSITSADARRIAAARGKKLYGE